MVIFRFRGVLEQPFTAFCWEDLASVDDYEVSFTFRFTITLALTFILKFLHLFQVEHIHMYGQCHLKLNEFLAQVLAIPQHRIQYFKYSRSKVWEKATRLDLIFGSTGDQRGIVQVMEEVDSEKQNEEDEESDDGEVELDVQEDRSEEHLLAEEERSTHFLAIRVTDPEVVANLCRVQESIATHEPILRECCMKTGLFHLTIGMLRLEGPDGLVAARSMMERLRPIVEEMFRDQDSAVLEIEGLGNFGQRVVYANVRISSLSFFLQIIPVQVAPKNEFWFNSLVDACKEAVSEAAPMVFSFKLFLKSKTKNQCLINSRNLMLNSQVRSTNSFEFVPHITIAKVTRC